LYNQSVVKPPKGYYIRSYDACGISAYMNIDGKTESGEKIVKMITTMMDRENGLGAGFAIYGIFPDRKDYFCFQMLLDDGDAKVRVRDYLKRYTRIIDEEPIRTRETPHIQQPVPVLWRFFLSPLEEMRKDQDEHDYMMAIVMYINSEIEGAYCMSSGKDMAVFKGNGWSRDVAHFYGIDEIRSYFFMAHSRFPTNTPGWWGGAHPFNLFGLSVVHNGEITSYGTNKRYVEMFGYRCTLMTDSEVVTYILDLLTRKQNLPLQVACMAAAPAYHEVIETHEGEKLDFWRMIRETYRSAMINGPFSICVGMNEPAPTLMGLTDRKKLRPLIAAISRGGKSVYLSSEECAIRIIGEEVEEVWAPLAGNPVIVSKGNGVVWRGEKNPLENTEVVMLPKSAYDVR
jgi:glutamate synthase domain-containing protein 1